MSEKDFDRAADFTRSLTETSLRLILMLLEYLEKREEHSHERELARWMRDNSGRVCVKVFETQGSVDNALRVELDKERIAYIDVNDGGVLVRDVDFEKVRELNKKILIAESKYYQEVSRSDLENAIAGYEKVKNKNIMSILCKDSIEGEVLKRKCNAISAGFMVGTSKTSDGAIKVSVHTAKMLDINQKGKDFCKAYLEMALSVYGPNATTKKQQILDDKKMDMEIAKLKGTRETRYVINAQDNTRFIELNQKGFSYYERSADKNGDIHDKKKVSCTTDNPNYELELERCKDRLRNKVILTNNRELEEHLKNVQVNFKSERTRKTKEEYNISLMEKRLADKIDTMIKGKWRNDFEEIMYMNSVEIFKAYTRECVEIMKAMSIDEAPKGYDEADFEELMDECVGNSIVFEDDYKKTMERLENQEVECHKARKRKEKTEINYNEEAYNAEKEKSAGTR